MLNITYKTGRGHLQISLESALPATTADFKRLIAYMDLSADPWTHAEKVHAFISEKVAELKVDRAKLNPETDKKRIAGIDAELKKYIANAAILTKTYGLPEISAGIEIVKMKNATVYQQEFDRKQHKTVVNAYAGWTFSKAGYTFDVYKSANKYYIVLLHGTGLKVADSDKKGTAPDAITPRIIDILNHGTAKIETAKKIFTDLMKESGYAAEPETEPETTAAAEPETEPETTAAEPETTAAEPETTAAAEPETTADPDYIFTAESVTYAGKSFHAGYSITPSGAVVIFPDGAEKIRIEKDSSYYESAYAAADAARKQRSETISDDPEPAAAEPETEPEPAAAEPETEPEPAAAEPETEPEPAAAEPEPEPEPEPARDPKAARGPVPEKTFVGQTIRGNGWQVYFDGDLQRTRIIFDQEPTPAAKKAVQDAGFYYSGQMKSWNKKLTFKAYRAAKVLSDQLSKIYAA